MAQWATLAHERIAVEDVVVATLKFANGALGVIEATTAAYPGYLKKIEIHGSEGSAFMEEEDIKKWDFKNPDKRDRMILEAMNTSKSTGGGAGDPTAIGHHGHARQFEDLLNAVKKNTAPSVDGREGRRSVEIILAIYKSAESGKPVMLPLEKDPPLNARKKKVDK
ncbi:MAG: Gfo/Idh/MocA family oxidoreductase [Pirellulales bacterium]